MDKKELKKLLVLLGVLFIIGFGSYYSSEQDKKQAEIKRKQEITQTAKDYNDGLWYLEKGNFEGAKSRLSRFYDGKYNNEDKYKDAQILAVYAMARYREWEPGVPMKLQYQFASDELSKIPDGYIGQYAPDIKTFKQKVKDRLATYKRTEEDQKKERETKIYIGDSEYKLIKVFGEPLRKNRTVTNKVVREQWVYEGGKYIYLENGLVTSWQD